MWISPLCDEKCGVTVNVMDLTLSELMKINEYREIVNTHHYLAQKNQPDPNQE